jgi:hypothetical protein
MTFIPNSGGGGGSGVIYDTFANRPAASTAGRIFVPTDNGLSQLDTGTEWRNLVNGLPFAEPPSHSTLATTTNFGTSSLNKANGILTFNCQSSASQNIRMAGKAIVSPATPSIVFGLDIVATMILGTTSPKAATNVQGGAGVYFRRVSTQNTMALVLRSTSANNPAVSISFQYWSSNGTSLAAEETAREPFADVTDSAHPFLFRLRYVQADARLYADMSNDRGNTWSQIYQTPNSDFLSGDPTEFGVCGYTNTTTGNPFILGRFWHLDMVG